MASSKGRPPATGGGSGICVFNLAANTTNLNIYSPMVNFNQRWGVDVAASFTTKAENLGSKITNFPP